MEQSRYGHYSRSRVQRHPRSPALPGSFEDSGRWYRCWNCGFVYDINKVGGNPDQDSRYQTEAIYPAYPPTLSGDPLAVILAPDNLGEIGTMMELGPQLGLDSKYISTISDSGLVLLAGGGFLLTTDGGYVELSGAVESRTLFDTTGYTVELKEIYSTKVHHVANGCPSCGTANLP